MRKLKTFFQWWSGKPHFSKFMPHVIPHLDRFISRVTGGKTTLTQLMMPMVVLYAIGAKSGKERATPLAAFPYNEGWIVIGSNFGREKHPAWSGNLLATPDVWAEPGGGRIAVHAALLEGEARQTAWDHVLTRWATFAAYDERTPNREIRVFHLTPRAEAAA
ncbi:MAG: deazaflavin-dependent oxidoreductase (nitroreductase family) [Glaciecola sp.]|jgi:deazaflavin-dependent oxidoreductase (nitroreductase family)